MRNELFHIGPFTVYGYGLMIAIGVFAAWIVAEYRAKKLKLQDEHVFYIVVWCLVGGMICSKLLFWMTEWKQVLEDPAFLLETMADGFVVYGGIIGGVLAGWFYCRAKRLSFLSYFDLLAPSVALAQGFGRLGCLLAGCCYGRETDSWFHIVFHHSDFAPNDVPLIPTQICSSVLDFLHFAVLLFLARRKKAEGQVGAAYLILYSIGRFLLEFSRGDLIRGSVGSLSTSQFISVFTFIAGVFLMLRCSRKRGRKR